MGLIYATIGEHEAAVQQFMAAIALDPFLAIAYVISELCHFHLDLTKLLGNSYFQCGVSNFLLSRYDIALQNFDDALLYLRGNQAMSVLLVSFSMYHCSNHPVVTMNKSASNSNSSHPKCSSIKAFLVSILAIRPRG
jgi:tetratricopeptide (TPR) repeat protein